MTTQHAMDVSFLSSTDGQRIMKKNIRSVKIKRCCDRMICLVNLSGTGLESNTMTSFHNCRFKIRNCVNIFRVSFDIFGECFKVSFLHCFLILLHDGYYYFF